MIMMIIIIINLMFNIIKINFKSVNILLYSF